MVKEKVSVIIESIYRKPIGNTTGKSRYLVVSWPSPWAGSAGGKELSPFFEAVVFPGTGVWWQLSRLGGQREQGSSCRFH